MNQYTNKYCELNKNRSRLKINYKRLAYVSLFQYIYIMSFNKEIIGYNNQLYEVVRKFKDHPDFPIAEAKDYYLCETVLKKEGILYICRIIEDAQVIEETYE